MLNIQNFRNYYTEGLLSKVGNIVTAPLRIPGKIQQAAGAVNAGLNRLASGDKLFGNNKQPNSSSNVAKPKPTPSNQSNLNQNNNINNNLPSINYKGSEYYILGSRVVRARNNTNQTQLQLGNLVSSNAPGPNSNSYIDITIP